RVWQGRGRVRLRAGRARRRGGRPVADRAGEVSDDARGPAGLRSAVTRKQRLVALALVWTLPSAITVSTTALVYSAYRIDPPSRLGDADRTAVMRSLRAALSGAPAVPCTVHVAHDADMPVAVTVWAKGAQVGRVDGYGGDIAAAVDQAASALRALP